LSRETRVSQGSAGNAGNAWKSIVAQACVTRGQRDCDCCGQAKTALAKHAASQSRHKPLGVALGGLEGVPHVAARIFLLARLVVHVEDGPGRARRGKKRGTCQESGRGSAEEREAAVTQGSVSLIFASLLALPARIFQQVNPPSPEEVGFITRRSRGVACRTACVQSCCAGLSPVRGTAVLFGSPALAAAVPSHRQSLTRTHFCATGRQSHAAYEAHPFRAL